MSCLRFYRAWCFLFPLLFTGYRSVPSAHGVRTDATYFSPRFILFVDGKPFLRDIIFCYCLAVIVPALHARIGDVDGHAQF